jgi:hypothetical protein
MPTTEERFWAFVDRSNPDGCWPWIGKDLNGGYGRFSIVPGKRVNASKFIFELTYGSLGPKEMACHTCDYRRCCRPAHLFRGTAKINMQDAAAKGRMATGERNGRNVYLRRVRGIDHGSTSSGVGAPSGQRQTLSLFPTNTMPSP